MVGYDSNNNALTLADDDSLSVGDYELEYSSSDDQWQARYSRPIGGRNGNHGQIQGATYSVDAQVGDNSLQFDGNNDRVTARQISQIDPTNAFSISAWVKFDSFTGQRNIIVGNHKNVNNRAMIIRRGDGTIGLDLYDGSTYAAGTSFSDTGVWKHVVITSDGTPSNALFYLDTTSYAIGSANYHGGMDTHGFAIGGNIGNDNYYTDGRIDDVRVYNKQLTSTEVTNLFNGSDVTSGLINKWSFEYPETTDVALDVLGDIYPKNDVPRSTTGSLVPQGLAESVSAGEVLADDGNTYTNLQNAVNNASSWAFAGPGTFSNVDVSSNNFLLEGSGYDTYVDGGASGDNAVDINGSNVVVRNLSASTTPGSGTNLSAFQANSPDISFINCYARESDQHGFYLKTNDQKVINCVSENSDKRSVQIEGPNCIVKGCKFEQYLRVVADDNIVTGNILLNPSEGIIVAGNDNVVGGNRVLGSGNDGLRISGTDNIVYNNRLSDSSVDDLDDNGAGTVLDGNLTGASN